jgi:hypothetical protein
MPSGGGVLLQLALLLPALALVTAALAVDVGPACGPRPLPVSVSDADQLLGALRSGATAIELTEHVSLGDSAAWAELAVGELVLRVNTSVSAQAAGLAGLGSVDFGFLPGRIRLERGAWLQLERLHLLRAHALPSIGALQCMCQNTALS